MGKLIDLFLGGLADQAFTIILLVVIVVNNHFEKKNTAKKHEKERAEDRQVYNDAIAELKAERAESIAELKLEHAATVAEFKREMKELRTQLEYYITNDNRLLREVIDRNTNVMQKSVSVLNMVDMHITTIVKNDLNNNKQT